MYLVDDRVELRIGELKLPNLLVQLIDFIKLCTVNGDSTTTSHRLIFQPEKIGKLGIRIFLNSSDSRKNYRRRGAAELPCTGKNL